MGNRAGTEMHHDSFQLITVENIGVIGLERLWGSEAKLVLRVIMPCGCKERVVEKSPHVPFVTPSVRLCSHALH